MRATHFVRCGSLLSASMAVVIRLHWSGVCLRRRIGQCCFSPVAQMTRSKETQVAEETADVRRRNGLNRGAVISMLLAANQFAAAIERVCQSEGVSHAQFTALWVLCLADDPEGVPMGALVDSSLHPRTDTTRLVNRLVEQGLAVRSPSEADRRVVLVKPTDEGRARFEIVSERVNEVTARYFAGLAASDIKGLTSMLNAVRLRMDDPDLA